MDLVNIFFLGHKFLLRIFSKVYFLKFVLIFKCVEILNIEEIKAYVFKKLISYSSILPHIFFYFSVFWGTLQFLTGFHHEPADFFKIGIGLSRDDMVAADRQYL